MKVLDRWERIQAAGAEVLVVVHDSPERIRAGVLDGLAVPFPVLVDEQRTAYRAWGLRRASFWRVYLSRAVWRQYWRLLRSGERMRRGGRDTLQLGGDFVVGRDGRLTYSRPQQADDRPPVGILVRELERAAGQGGDPRPP